MTYQDINRAHWDGRAAAHAASPGYDVDRFANEPDFISHVVRFDVPRLGDLTGVRGVHLQCHIGTDTISLARLGARMTGLDLSAASVEQARRIAGLAGSDTDFVVSEVYDARTALGEEMFDLVFTGVGALCWLPSIEQWADVVDSLLKPGGRLFVREGHPMLWSIDEEQEDRIVVDYAYFETDEPAYSGESEGTYVETDAVFTDNTFQNWNHGLGEIVTALLTRGFRITGLEEHDSVPWDALPGKMELDGTKEWRLSERPERLPLSYTLQAVKEPVKGPVHGA